MSKQTVTIILLGIIIRHTYGACLWPSVFTNTAWRDNSKGNISFTTDKLIGWTILITQATPFLTYSNWKCHSTSLYTSDNIIVAVTESTFVLYSKDFYGYICLKLAAITGYSYRYYLYNPEEAGAASERMSVRLTNNDTNLTALCMLNSTTNRPAISEYRVMIKTGSESSAKIDFPYVILGSYDYNHTDSNGALTCDTSTDTMSMCQDSKEMRFNYTTCTTKVAYSKSNAVWCVDTVPSGGINYVTVYNGNDADADINNADVFRFSCFAISDDGTKATVAPSRCRNGQTSTSAPTNCSVLTMTRYASISCPTCPALVPPTSGSVSYTTDGANTKSIYSCSAQYSLAGSSTRACQNNRTWAGESPTCTCILPSTPANGTLAVSTDGTLTYSCNVGFVLNGSRTRSCQNSTNSWSGVQPSCDPCDTIPTSGGLTTSTLSTGTTTIAVFNCSAGYTLSGSTSATCLVSRLWNASIPSCVFCASFNTSGGLNATLSTDGYISTATFTCLSGYQVLGASSATCSVLGQWSSVPTCECNAQAAPANGTRTGNGSVSYFSCNVGFNLIGSASSSCMTNGTGWNSNTPTCNACSSLTSPTGGYFNLTTSGLVTMATFSCKTSYTMSGSRTRYCQSAGTWNGTTPTCVKCPDLVDPSSGTVTVSTDGVTSKGYYACATAYNISGSSNTTCKTDGTWTNTAPTCYCLPASKPTNGAVLSDNGVFVSYKCNLNYSMSGSSARNCLTNGTGWSGTDPVCVPCATLRQVSGGSVTFTTDDINTKATYSCDVGYTLSGNKVMTCQSSGVWDAAQSNCTKCDAPTVPTGGNVTLQIVDNTITKAAFTCNVGYTLKGYSELMCKDTGSWDNSAPECVQCNSRTNPNSGNFTMQTDGITTTGTYYCADGYNLVGQSTVTCRNTGVWNLPAATCACKTPTAPINGTVTADGMTVTFTCNTGFTLSGNSSGTCRTDGTGWSISEPQCVACKSLSSFTGGNLSYTSDGTTTIVKYSCPTGTSLLGSAKASCNATGNWMADIPTCVTCPNLPDVSVSTGSVTLVTDGTTTTAQYTCPVGYEVKGETTLTCTTNGTWSSNASDCVCQTPTAPSGGNYTLSSDGFSVVFSCGRGYTMAGTQTVGCAKDGSGWNITTPTCTKCNDLTLPSNGNITLVTTGTQTTALYTCGLGYTLSGYSAPKCLPNGTWSTSVSSQTCVSCPTLPAIIIPNGSVTLGTDGTTTTAVYSCPNGYEVKGQTTLTCGTNGSWDLTPSTCVCSKPIVPTGGNYTTSADGLTVTFSCDAGYTMNGNHAVTCATDGSGWTLTFPNCTKCGTLTSPAGGNVSLATNGTQTEAVYTCNVGSSLKGVAKPACQDNGTWTDSQPQCVSCPVLPPVSITTGSVNLVTDGTTTTAVYNCPTGYKVNGAQNITCSTNGTWMSSPSDCVCDTPNSPTGGNLSVSSDGLSVTFLCNNGYTMAGSQNISCAKNGSGWNTLQPNCTKCANLTSPAGGAVTLTTTGTQTTAIYTCGLGYSLSGQSTPQCKMDGTWTAQQPSCVGCPSAVNITNGDLNVTTDGQKTRALFTCKAGYTMDGNATLTCLTSGQWDDLSPTCYCSPPSAPVFGTVVANHTTAVYTCDQGYILKGTSVRSCQNNGQGWTGATPSCISCDALSAPTNGFVMFSSNGTLTVAMFSCTVGFSMNGSQTLVCLVNGSWSGLGPACVRCPTLGQPNSGAMMLSTNNIMTSANYSCVTGYHIVGTSLLTCSASGNWSDTAPFCACDNVTSPANGGVNISLVQGVAVYTCNLGYSISGVAQRTCGSDGSGWSASQPSCVGCSNISSTANGSSSKVSNGTVTSVHFTCHAGSTLNGDSVSTCQSDGTWSAAQPSCVTCPNLSKPTGGNVSVTTDGLTSTVTYTCAASYLVVGAASRQCQTDGMWSGPGNTSCICQAPSSPSNGAYTLHDGDKKIVYTCDLLYTLKGDSERICQDNGSGWTGNDPTCVRYTELSPPTNGNVTFSSNGTHTIATFTCHLGATLKGDSVLIWLPEGTWSSKIPTCAMCPSLSSPTSGNLSLSTDGTVTIANITCPADYYVNGNPVLACLDTGRWSSSTVPECLCNTPSNITNGHLASNGKIASYTCNKGYSMSGSPSMSCKTDGSGWDNVTPTCVPCATLSSGNLTFSTTGINTIATFRCALGTTLNGSSVLKCDSNGIWNSTTPSCVSCESYMSPANGQYDVSSDGVTTSLRLQCDEGYTPSGQTSVQCGTDGKWKFSQTGTCEQSLASSSSLLNALIAVIVTSLIIICILSILLARYVYLYKQRLQRGVGYLTDESKNGYHQFPVQLERMTTSMAPVNHQRHVLESGSSISTSPAPPVFEKSIIGNGVVPQSPPPIETYRSEKSIVSFRRSATSVGKCSTQSLSEIKISNVPQKETEQKAFKGKDGKQAKDKRSLLSSSPITRSNRLSPIPNHDKLVGKLGQSPQIKRLKVEDGLSADGRSSPEARSATPTKSHSLCVTDYDSKSLDSVSMIDN